MYIFIYILFFPILWLLSLLPFRVLYFLSKGVYFITFYIIKYRRKIVYNNIKNSFPEKSEAEISLIIKRFYKHFSRFFFEIIKQITISESEIKKRVKYKNPEVLLEMYNKGIHGIVVTAHYGNWEWLTALSDSTPYRTMSVYKPLANKPLEKLLTKLRTRFGTELVPMNQVLKKMIQYKNQGNPTLSCFITDQTPIYQHIQYWTKFLNQDTPIYLGVEKIARQLNLAVLFYKMNPVKLGYYEIEIIKLFDDVSNLSELEITEAHVRALETTIHEKPEYWLWTHRRWKYSKEVHQETMKNAYNSKLR